MEDEVQEAQDSEKQHRSQTWGEWQKTALQGSARAMHRFSRIFEAWTPTVAVHQGTFTASPDKLVEAEAALADLNV